MRIQGWQGEGSISLALWYDFGRGYSSLPTCYAYFQSLSLQEILQTTQLLLVAQA